jgi:hypothetical protein
VSEYIDAIRNLALVVAGAIGGALAMYVKMSEIADKDRCYLVSRHIEQLEEQRQKYLRMMKYGGGD